MPQSVNIRPFWSNKMRLGVILRENIAQYGKIVEIFVFNNIFFVSQQNFFYWDNFYNFFFSKIFSLATIGYYRLFFSHLNLICLFKYYSVLIGRHCFPLKMKNKFSGVSIRLFCSWKKKIILAKLNPSEELKNDIFSYKNTQHEWFSLSFLVWNKTILDIHETLFSPEMKKKCKEFKTVETI